MERSRNRESGVSLKRVRKVFERSEASLGHSLPIRKTINGIWVPTPVRVIEQAVAALAALRLLGEAVPQRPIVDAGTGDGRIPAVLAAFDPTQPVYGIEQDPLLFAQALENLHTLKTSRLLDDTHLVEGDFRESGTYAACGLDFGDTGLVFNYPDGNEKRLAQFVWEHGGAGTMLCLLTHNRALELDELELRVRQDVGVGVEPPWRLSVYSLA